MSSKRKGKIAAKNGAKPLKEKAKYQQVLKQEKRTKTTTEEIKVESRGSQDAKGKAKESQEIKYLENPLAAQVVTKLRTSGRVRRTTQGKSSATILQIQRRKIL